MAADTAIFDRHCYCGEVTKIYPLPDGSLFGVAGAVGDLIRFRRWMFSGREGDFRFTDEDSEALVVDPTGQVHWWGHADGSGVQIEGNYFAIGSGFRIAMGAMAAGASAESAVAICCNLDAHTRRPINSLFHPTRIAPE